MPDQTDSVFTPCAEYDSMVAAQRLFRDLRSTDRMRHAGERWLPRRKLESATSGTSLVQSSSGAVGRSADTTDPYQQRLAETYLLPVYWQAVKDQTSAIVNGPAILDPAAPPDFRQWMRNVDLEGSSLETFAWNVCCTGLDWGLTHILTDYHQLPSGATKRDAEEIGARPYWTHIPPSRLIGWKYAEESEGYSLSEIRFTYEVRVDEGKWGTKTEERCKVLRPGEFEVWGKGKSGDELLDEGFYGPGYIPLRTFYTSRGKALLTGVPFNEELGWLNLELWQKGSARNNYLAWALIAGFAFNGYDEDELPEGMQTAIMTRPKNPNANVETFRLPLEPVQEARKDIEEGVKAAQWLSRRPQMQRAPGTRTATESLLETQQGDTQLAHVSMTLQNTLNACAGDMGAYVKRVFGEWIAFDDVAALPSESMGQVLSVLESIASLPPKAREVALNEARSRNVLSEDIDVAELVREIGDGVPVSANDPRLSGLLRDAEFEAGSVS